MVGPTTDRQIQNLPDLSKIPVRRSLRRRHYPYWHPLAYGRFLGYYRGKGAETHWVARYRGKDGKYHQCRIGVTDDNYLANDDTVLSFEQALERTWRWFRTPEAACNSGNPKSFGRVKDLLYTPIGNVYTFGHALRDYLEWKRLTSAEPHYDIIVSLINYHILPRFGTLALDELRGECFLQYFQEVLETAPKRGNRSAGPRQQVSSWDDEAIRKRKKTVNALITIVRDSLQRAWENSKTDNDRLWRSLRTIPDVDRPRMLHLSRTECRLLLKHCRPDLRPLVLGALYTGCRSLELLRLRVSDVGRDAYGVYVMPSKTRKPRFVFCRTKEWRSF